MSQGVLGAVAELLEVADAVCPRSIRLAGKLSAEIATGAGARGADYGVRGYRGRPPGASAPRPYRGLDDRVEARRRTKRGGHALGRARTPLFMVAALENDELIHEAPATDGCQTPSALARAAGP